MSDTTTNPTNHITPSWSRDVFVTPPPITSEGSPVVSVEMSKSHHQSSKLPLKSALRRSERLRKSVTGVASSAVQRRVGISNLVHVSKVTVCVCKSIGLGEVMYYSILLHYGMHV